MEFSVDLSVDVRGDGVLPFELGHLAPNGDTMGDVFAGLRTGWRSSMSKQILILDIANDEGGVVSQQIVDEVYDEILDTRLAELQIVITGANLEMLARMRALHDLHSPKLDCSCSASKREPAMREALTSHSDVIGVITDHPRRAATW